MAIITSHIKLVEVFEHKKLRDYNDVYGAVGASSPNIHKFWVAWMGSCMIVHSLWLEAFACALSISEGLI